MSGGAQLEALCTGRLTVRLRVCLTEGPCTPSRTPLLLPSRRGEYQAEVGLLTRRILFTSDATSTATGLGPHTTAMSPNVRISGAAFERWAARNQAGRYSVHFHLAGEAPQAFVKNCAFYR